MAWGLELVRAIYLMASSNSVSKSDKIAFLDHFGEVRTTLMHGLNHSQPRVLVQEACMGHESLPGSKLSADWPTDIDRVRAVLPSNAMWALSGPTTIFQIAFGADFDWHVAEKVSINPRLLTSRTKNR
jgi:hypothetical protein